MATESRSGTVGRITGMVAGLQQGLLPKAFQFYSDQVSYTTSGLLTKLQSLVAPMNAVAAAKAALEAAEKAADQAETLAKAVLDDAEMDLKSFFGSESTKLTAFDVSPEKARTPLTTEQMLQMALKAKATRAARGTLSPKQKKAIKATSVPPTTLKVTDAGVAVVPEAPAETATPTAASATVVEATPTAST